jgi:hypothetical protein
VVHGRAHRDHRQRHPKRRRLPCPGVGDVALGVTDTQLHFVYNLIAYGGTVLPAAYLLWSRRPGRPVRPGTAGPTP